MKGLLFIGGILVLIGGLWWWEKAVPLQTEEKVSPLAQISEVPPALAPIQEVVETESAPSITDFFEKKFDGRDLTLVRVLEKNNAYTRHYVTYKSGALTISGIMHIPLGTPPVGGFPVLILNHGHIDTAIYTNGRGLRREQDFLARAGFIVLHPDYRNHAESSDIDEGEIENRLGYVEDVINAVYAVRAADLPYANKEKIGMLGHSMGGGITQTITVATPDLVKAVVLYAPVSMDYRDSYFRYMADNPERASRVRERFGTPEENPAAWDGLSPATFVERWKVPALLFHGTADKDVPIAWSEKTVALLKEHGKSIEYIVYPGEGHEFGPRFTDFMQRTAEFFRIQLEK